MINAYLVKKVFKARHARSRGFGDLVERLFDELTGDANLGCQRGDP
jgi:hypothetical protein